MAELLVNLVKRILIFLIVGQTFFHFGMGKTYERYVKLMISLMITAQFAAAIYEILTPFRYSKEINLGQEAIIGFEEQWEKNQEDFMLHLQQQQDEVKRQWEEKAKSMEQKTQQKEAGRIHIEEIIIP